MKSPARAGRGAGGRFTSKRPRRPAFLSEYKNDILEGVLLK